MRGGNYLHSPILNEDESTWISTDLISLKTDVALKLMFGYVDEKQFGSHGVKNQYLDWKIYISIPHWVLVNTSSGSVLSDLICGTELCGERPFCGVRLCTEPYCTPCRRPNSHICAHGTRESDESIFVLSQPRSFFFWTFVWSALHMFMCVAQLYQCIQGLAESKHTCAQHFVIRIYDL